MGRDRGYHPNTWRRLPTDPSPGSSLQLLPNLYHLRSSGARGACVGAIQDKLESMAGEVARVMDEQLQVRSITRQLRPLLGSGFNRLNSTDDAGVHGGRRRGAVSSRHEAEQRPSPGAAEGGSGQDERPSQLHHQHAAGAVWSGHHQQDQVRLPLVSLVSLALASPGALMVSPHDFFTVEVIFFFALCCVCGVWNSEVKLSMASYLSDRIADEILESLSRSQRTLVSAGSVSASFSPFFHLLHLLTSSCVSRPTT